MENSQSILIVKDAEIRRSTVRIACSEEQSRVTRQLLAKAYKGSKVQSIASHRGIFEETRHVTYEFTQPSQQKPRTEMEFSR